MNTGFAKTAAAVFAACASVCAFADRTANQEWVAAQIEAATNSLSAWTRTEISNAAPTKRIAMFIVPLNDSSGYYTGFELKASLCNFTAEEEDERLQFYAQSEIADTGSGTDIDTMALYVCTSLKGTDKRAYTRIKNTLADFDAASHPPATVVALVDFDGLRRRRDSDWLREDNDMLTWVFLRTLNASPAHEKEAETEAPQWRPITPVKWYKNWPVWAGARNLK